MKKKIDRPKKEKWYFQHVRLDDVNGWGANALFPESAVIKKGANWIVTSSKCAIHSGEGWDASLEYNDIVIVKLLEILNSK